MILIAIDAGGTRTRASVVDDSLACAGTGRAGRGNPVGGGPEAAFDQVMLAMTQAAAVAGVALREISSVTLAGAGGAVFDPGFLTRRLAEAGMTSPLTVKGDLAALFCSGSHETSGYSVVAGTGATAVRIVDNVEVQVADGLGWLLGDTGSGFWIGRRVARAVAAAMDGRAPTTMVEPALGALGIQPDLTLLRGRPVASHELVKVVYAGSPLAVAALAPVAFLDEGDEVSAEIVAEAARGLAQSLIDVYVDDVSGPLVIGGGVMSAQPRLREGMLAALASEGRDLRVIQAVDGLVGASVLALRDAGVIVDAAVFDRLRSTTALELARPACL
ncbi:MAG: BadF/BadG/BcrA/BcrD ATPase family protein [Knoellia sp.]